MKTIKRSSQFKSDFKKILRVPRYRGFEETVREVVGCLITGAPLPARFLDHPLKGGYVGYRECHLRPDLLLIYREDDAENLTLIRIGTHSNLFGK